MSWIRDLDNGRYQAIYRDGLKRQRSQTFDRKKDARAWLAAQEVNLSSGRWTDPRAGEVTFGRFVERWRLGRDVAPTTEASDKGRLENHLLPAFKDWPLNSIRYLDVMAWMKDLADKKQLQPKTRRECLALLKMILEAAVTEEKIPANPAASVKPPPKIKPTQRELRRSEVDAVVFGKARLSLRARLGLAAFCGTRWGEACGLRIGSVDLDARTVAITETMEEIGAHFRRKPYPKDREPRVVPISEPYLPLLTELLKVREAQGATEDDLVFVSVAGSPIYRSNNDRALALACRTAKIKPFNYKDLRRFCASYLINERGVSVTAARELLGHSKASMTLEVYTAVPTQWHDDVRAAFAEA